MQEHKEIWFPAKRYGWGWGLPVAWQGWVVLVLFIGSLSAVTFLFPPTRELPLFVILVVIIVALLVAVCFAKGERPTWRWGEK